jgi:hypothetical protein
VSKRLPVVGSTASTTSYCSVELDGPGGIRLYFDGNGKVTAGNGTLHDPKPNAFSLPSAGVSGIEHCPQSTETCRKACYVENLKDAEPALYNMYLANAQAIRTILDGCYVHPKHGMLFTGLAADWVQTFAAWIIDNASAGFRWHVSGDVFSIEYAYFIAAVCEASKPVSHWIYTRSFDFVEPLVSVSTGCGGNLAVNLSCDKDNIEHAATTSVQYSDPGDWLLRLCYLVTSLDEELPSLTEHDVIFPDYALRPRQFATLAESPWWQALEPEQRGLVCPVDAHGKAENRRCGPCTRCLT